LLGKLKDLYSLKLIEKKLEKKEKRKKVNTRKFFYRKNINSCNENCKKKLQDFYKYIVLLQPKYHNYNYVEKEFIKNGNSNWTKEIKQTLQASYEQLELAKKYNIKVGQIRKFMEQEAEKVKLKHDLERKEKKEKEKNKIEEEKQKITEKLQSIIEEKRKKEYKEVENEKEKEGKGKEKEEKSKYTKNNKKK